MRRHLPINHEAKIYIIDDNTFVSNAISTLFGFFIKNPIQIYDDPLKFLHEYSCDWKGCIITDFFMPQINGIELMQQLNRLGNSMPVIIISANGNAENKILAKNAGAIDFISKPFKTEYLIHSIQSLLAKM